MRRVAVCSSRDGTGVVVPLRCCVLASSTAIINATAMVSAFLPTRISPTPARCFTLALSPGREGAGAAAVPWGPPRLATADPPHGTEHSHAAVGRGDRRRRCCVVPWVGCEESHSYRTTSSNDPGNADAQAAQGLIPALATCVGSCSSVQITRLCVSLNLSQGCCVLRQNLGQDIHHNRVLHATHD